MFKKFKMGKIEKNGQNCTRCADEQNCTKIMKSVQFNAFSDIDNVVFNLGRKIIYFTEVPRKARLPLKWDKTQTQCKNDGRVLSQS